MPDSEGMGQTWWVYTQGCPVRVKHECIMVKIEGSKKRKLGKKHVN